MKTTFKCNLCDKVLSSRYSLNNHILGQHEGLRNSVPKQFKCNLCHFETYMKSGLLEHSRTHTNERPFNCTKLACTLAFKTQKAVRRHVNHKHCSERPFKCDFPDCLRAAKTLRILNQHKKVHREGCPFVCPHTGCYFRAKIKLYISRHFATVHSKTKHFACSTCEFRTAQAMTLNYHMARHSTRRDFKCSYPTRKKTFKRPLDLKRHFSNRHGERNFECDHRSCVRKFGSANLLYKHKFNCHAKKRLACQEPECNYSTNHSSGFARHMNFHQRRNQMISCSIDGCDYKGKDSEAVEVHMHHHKTLLACPETGCSQYIHTQEKVRNNAKLRKHSAGSFHCPLCFKHFRTLRILQEHCITHTKEKQFMCGHCDYATAKHLGVKNHIASAHSSVPFPFITHLKGVRECLRCKVTLPTKQFLIHTMAHAAPVVIMKRLKIKVS